MLDHMFLSANLRGFSKWSEVFAAPRPTKTLLYSHYAHLGDSVHTTKPLADPHSAPADPLPASRAPRPRPRARAAPCGLALAQFSEPWF